MHQRFDPYHRWLGIPPHLQPPDYYRLLGLEQYEPDADVIEEAADRQMAHVRSKATGQRVEIAQNLLNELAVARACLLNAVKKRAYDEQLRAKDAEHPSPGRLRETPLRPPPPVGAPQIERSQPVAEAPPPRPPKPRDVQTATPPSRSAAFTSTAPQRSPRQQAVDLASPPALGLMIVAPIGIAFALLHLIVSVNNSNAVLAAFDMTAICCHGVVFWGGLQMKSLEGYPWAIAASILAVVPCLSPCCVAGIPLGVWALVVLIDPMVKDQFR